MSRQILDMSNDKLEELFSKTNDNFEEVYQRDSEQDKSLQELENSKAEDTDLKALKSRVDNLVANPGTPTEGNAELIDIRVGADGKTYPTAGEAVRSQISSVSTNYDDLASNFTREGVDIYWELGSFNLNTGGNHASTNRIRTRHLPIHRGDKIIFSTNSDTSQANYYTIYLYDNSLNYLPDVSNPTWIRDPIFESEIDGYVRLGMRTYDSQELTLDDIPNLAEDLKILYTSLHLFEYSKASITYDKLDGSSNNSDIIMQHKIITTTGGYANSSTYASSDISIAYPGDVLEITLPNKDLNNVFIYFFLDPEDKLPIKVSSNLADNFDHIRYVFEEKCYFGFRLLLRDITQLSDSDLAAIQSNVYFNSLFDSKTKWFLAKTNKLSNSNFDDWEIGSFNLNNGGNYASTNRIRTANQHYCYKGSTFSVPSDYDLTVYQYDELGNFLNYINWTKQYTIDISCNIRLGLRKSDNSELLDTSISSNLILDLIAYDLYTNLDDNTNKIIESSSRLSKLEDTYNGYDRWKVDSNALQKFQGDKFTFAVQTDTHFDVELDSDYIYPLADMSNYIGFDFICNLGDIIRGYEYNSYESMQTAMTSVVNRYKKNLSCPLLLVIGNHDDAAMWTASNSKSLDEVILPPEQYAKLIKPIRNTLDITTNGKSLYYYKDFTECRVIVLNMRDLLYQNFSSNDISISHYRISQDQVDWLENDALNTNLPIIVMCHVPLATDLIPSSDNFTFENYDKVVTKIIDFKNSGGTIVGLFYGHSHLQASKIDDNGINHIVFKNGGNFAEVVSIDFSNRSINTKMIGKYPSECSDRTFNF